MATARTTRPIEHRARPAPYVKSGRRQYQSCDHCRQNRRACDAAALGVDLFLGENHHDDNAPKACSSCTRSKKQCTFHWLLSRPRSALPPSIKRKIDARSTAAGHRISMSPPGAIYESAYPNVFPGGLESNGIDAYETAVPGLAEQIHGSSSPESPWNLHQFNVTLQREYQPLKSLYTHPNFTATSISAGCTIPFDHFNTPRGDRPKSFDLSSQEVLGSSAFHYDDGTGSTASSLLQPSSRTVHPSRPDYLTMEDDDLSIDNDLPATTGAFGVNSLQAGSRKSSVPTHQWANNSDGIFDPFNSLQESISQGTNNSLISSSLLRIYYNSFENALSCWVTESNCPYQKLKRKETELLHPAPNRTAEVRRHLSIYARVCRLDETFAPFHGQLMTKSDSPKASKSIYAAILAFASQWSHARNTNTFFDGFNSMSSRSPNTSTTFDDAAPFESLVQQSLWHECRRSLLACDDSDSFKVIFARMIFSMTQQPHAIREHENSPGYQDWPQDLAAPDRYRVQCPSGAANLGSTTLPSASFNSGDMSGLEAGRPVQINAVTDWDSPPIYLEKALRHLASWRRRIATPASTQSYTAMNAQLPRGDDLQSFDMLFWLGVMCDTTSSALTQRPLVIGEHDCELPKATFSQAQAVYQTSYAQRLPPYGIGDTNRAETAPELWGTYLLSPQPHSGAKARWPCGTDEAFATLQEAIPVKVLLWRRVARLQTLNAWTDQRDVEDLISATLSVYQHWTVTYDQFMRDCIANHEALPAKVQSWYVILAMHWHLGCLLAANCIEWVDNDSLSANLQRALRRSSGLVLELKKANSNAIADLARVSCSNDRQTFRDSAEFHPALSETPLLTEPWTNVLVQALEKACSVFLTWISRRRHVLNKQNDWVYLNTNYSDLCRRASSCIYGLKMLRQKSDSASLTAAALETQLTFIMRDRSLSVSSIR